MKKLIAALLVVSVLAVQPARAGEDKDGGHGGVSLRGVEKGLQSAASGITKGARESGIEGGLRRAGTGVKNAAESLEKKVDKGARKAKQGKE